MEPAKKLKYRDLLMNLIWENKVLHKLFEGNKRYTNLLRELMKYDMDDDEPLPLQKDLLENLDMSRTKLMNLMEGLYEDFHKRLFNPNAYSIADTEICLFVKTRDDYWPIGLDNLGFIPREGDDFTIEFIGEVWDARYLTVKSVIHEIENGVQKINIYLEKSPLE